MKDTLKGYVTKGVSFNCDDPDQRKMVEHAMERSNFSGYVKRLIQRDMENAQKQIPPKAHKSSSGGIKIQLD